MALLSALPPGQFLGTLTCTSDEELRNGWEADDELSVKQAACELIAGEISRPDCGHPYGYALEQLCRVLGTHLGTIAGKRGLLSHLGLGTQLREQRTPVPLPERDDFPEIGYLTAEELRNEVEQLGATDLSDPQRPEIEEDRIAFLAYLQDAARRGMGIVAFYY